MWSPPHRASGERRWRDLMYDMEKVILYDPKGHHWSNQQIFTQCGGTKWRGIFSWAEFISGLTTTFGKFYSK
jgi:hypothetical protein